MNKNSHTVYLVIALALMSFIAGRFSANSSLLEENRKLEESVRLLRGDRSGIASPTSGEHIWRDEKGPTARAATPLSARPAAVPSPVAAPAVAIAATTESGIAKPYAESGGTEATPQQEAVIQQEPEPTSAQATPEPIATSRGAPGRKTGQKWVSDLGDHIQGAATYWRCNNAKLVASGMEHYAYGSIPANRLQRPGDAYSVRDGNAIVISGCWSPKLGKAILYRKSDGRRWEPAFNLDDGTWRLVVE